jgi:putative tricarboxylic transport membrane protein
VAPLAVFGAPRHAVAWLRRLDIRIVAPLIVTICGVAIMSVTRNPVDLALMFAFGLVGYGMILADLDRSLVFFAFVLGPHLEEDIGRTLLIARGDVTAFVTRSTSAGFLAAGVVLLVAVRAWRYVRRTRLIEATARA